MKIVVISATGHVQEIEVPLTSHITILAATGEEAIGIYEGGPFTYNDVLPGIGATRYTLHMRVNKSETQDWMDISRTASKYTCKE